jgi:hypothetical protein
MRKQVFLFGRFGVIALAAVIAIIAPSMLADTGANHQTANTNFGVSGGNVKDISKSFCCSGTLGSLVRDTDGVNYILSNNHVLARSDQAAAGEDISQPGLIDNGCRIPPIVADFTTAPPLGSNVDAAIARLRDGAMNTTGQIEDVGIPSGIPATPAVGMEVAKSGRTSGFTTGTIASINTSVNVQYQRGCGQGKKFVVSYTNQVVINSSTFSAGGDSGSLIVTGDACHQPVALLYAGSSTTTIGNPIGEVLSKVSARLGKTISFVGTTCATSVGGKKTHSAAARAAQPSDESVQLATKAMRSRERDLMSRAGVIGVGVGALDDSSPDAAIIVYVDVSWAGATSLPRRIGGVRVKRVYTEPFVAY